MAMRPYEIGSRAGREGVAAANRTDLKVRPYEVGCARGKRRRGARWRWDGGTLTPTDARPFPPEMDMQTSSG